MKKKLVKVGTEIKFFFNSWKNKSSGKKRIYCQMMYMDRHFWIEKFKVIFVFIIPPTPTEYLLVVIWAVVSNVYSIVHVLPKLAELAYKFHANRSLFTHYKVPLVCIK